jgi:hypothetical protein
MYTFSSCQAIWPYSGHYHPTEENFLEFISFLEEHHVNLTNVKVISFTLSHVVLHGWPNSLSLTKFIYMYLNG